MADRQQIQPGEEVAVTMSARDRELLEEAFVDSEYIERLRPSPSGKGFIGRYTLDDLEDMLGYIAAEANHAEDKKRQKKLDTLYDRLFQIQRSYDDGDWNDSAI